MSSPPPRSLQPGTNPVVDAILAHDEGRKPRLVRLKYRRMDKDVFSFFRGANHLYAAAWPTLKPLDPGPDLLVCGDLHLENLGAYRAEGGDLLFDINDFDEALVGHCSLDLVRCSTSILLAAQVWGLSPIRAIRSVLGYLDHYRSTIRDQAEGRIPGIADPGPIGELIGSCLLGTQAELLDHVTRLEKSGIRSIRNLPGKLPRLGDRKKATVIEAVEAYGRKIGRAEAFRVLDASGRIAGIGSLGVSRYVVLVEGEGSPDANWLLDIKAAAPPTLRDCSTAPQPSHWTSDAVRVVDAQRRLQAEPTSGLDVISIEGREFRLREMIPDENRATLDRFRRKPAKLRRAVEMVGRLTANSQWRGARLPSGDDRTVELARWAASPALDAVLAASVRFAEKSREDFRAFQKGFDG